MSSAYRLAFVFLGLVALLYPLGIWLLFRMQSASPLMLTVGLAAVGACLICQQNLRSLGWSWGRWKYQWASYVIPLLYCSVAYFAIWGLGLGTWYDQGFVAELRTGYRLEQWPDAAIIAFEFLVTATLSFVLILPGVLGEEMGWRGVLVPALSKSLSFTQVCLFSGVVWAVWHWPIIIMGIYGSAELPIGYSLTVFTACIVSMSFIMTYIRYRTNSLWPAVVFHMSHNAFLQKFFTPLTEPTASSIWYIDEFGIAVPLVVAIIALVFWRKGRQLPGV